MGTYQRLTELANAPFFFRSLSYLLLTIYTFILFLTTTDASIFPNPWLFLLHLIIITLFALMCQANYPNHLTLQEANQRLALSVIPPALFLIGIKQRWSDLQILIKREFYGSYTLFTVIITMGISTLIYLIFLLELVFSLSISYFIYVISYTLLMYLPVYILDRYMIANNSGEYTSLDEIDEIEDIDLINWETSAITPEERFTNPPPLVNAFNTKKRRFNLLLLVSVLYFIFLRTVDFIIPISR